MAKQIHRNYRLPALRFSVQFVKREPLVQIRAYHGREELCVVSVPATDVGIHERLSVRAYRGAEFQLPRQEIQKLADAISACSDRGIVWLQIDRSAGFLAVVPWERLLAPVMPGAILRIPNFLVDTEIIEGPLECAICASAPAAKEFYPVADFLIGLIERIQQAVEQGTDIHVFSDKDAFLSLQARFADKGRTTPHRVSVYDPQRAEAFGRGSAEISDPTMLRSPWLRWIKAELADRGIDAVHFICPGFFDSERGSLALARSPVDNIDEAWSHFVGGSELCTFLSDLGAGCVAIEAPYGGVWSLGLRLLVDELAWTRPGPVMLYEAAGPNDSGVLWHAYRFLFAGNYFPPPAGGELMLYCHPRRLERYAKVPYFEAPTHSTESPDHEWLQATRQQLARAESHSKERRPKTGPNVILMDDSMPVSGKGTASPPEHRWARTNQLVIEQAQIDLSDQTGAFARGAAKALRFLAELQKKYLKEQD